MPDVNKEVEENMRDVLRRRIAAVCFNEYNSMAFHDLSRNKVATAAHNLTSLLGLGQSFAHRLMCFRFEIQNQ